MITNFTPSFINKPFTWQKPQAPKPPPPKIVARVRKYTGWAYVLDRPTSMVYHEEVVNNQQYLVGKDGPFFSLLVNRPVTEPEKMSTDTTTLTMEDGSTRTIVNNNWQNITVSLLNNTINIFASDVESLRKHYEFPSRIVDTTAFTDMIQQYNAEGGYQYRAGEYEKLLKYEDNLSHLKQQNQRLSNHVQVLIDRLTHLSK